MDNWYKKQEGKRILNTIDKEKFIKDIKRDLGFRNEKFYKKEIDNEFNGFGNFENLEKTLDSAVRICYYIQAVADKGSRVDKVSRR